MENGVILVDNFPRFLQTPLCILFNILSITFDNSRKPQQFHRIDLQEIHGLQDAVTNEEARIEMKLFLELVQPFSTFHLFRKGATTDIKFPIKNNLFSNNKQK